MKHWRIGLLGVAVSALAVYFIVSQIDVERLAAAFAAAHLVYFIPAAALLLVGLVTRALRWRVLLSNALPLWRAFHIMNVAYLVNGILPLRIGEVARAFLASRAEPPVPVFTSISTIIVERLLDLLAVLVLLVVAVVSAPLPAELRAAALLLGPAAFGGFLFLIVLARQRPLAHRLVNVITGRIVLLQRLNLDAWLSHFLDGLMPLTRLQTLGSALLWTVLSWLLSVAGGWILMLAFFGRADLFAACLFVAAASLAIAVPAVPGNIGTYEVSILLALGAVGYGDPSATATAFAIAVHGLNLVMYAVMGVWGFIQEGISLEQLSQGVQRIQRTNAG